MPKLKCTGCKQRFEKESMHKFGGSNYHSIDCATTYAYNKTVRANERKAAKAKRETKQKHSKQKKDFYDNDTKTRKAAAKSACHTYIKARDEGKPCICCGRDMKGKAIHSGHFLESGNNPIIRYHEDNISSQLAYCNMYQGGNSDDYEGRLRIKIGDERVDYLKANKGGTIKRTVQDYRDIEDYYKAKLEAIRRVIG